MSIDDDDWEPALGEHPTWGMDEIENHPLFMTEIPADSDNPHVKALQAALFDDETPFSICENFKNQGNEALKRGLIEDARIFYERALEAGCDDPGLVSIVHSNLALVLLKQGKYPECVDECYRSIGKNPGNFKAYMRGAKASLMLELYSQGTYFAKGGLDIDSSNVELTSIAVELEERKAALLKSRESEASAAASSSSSKPKLKYRWRD